MTDDLISRHAAIATAISGRVRTLNTKEDGEDWIRVNEVRESLLNLPAAEHRWIPVTERLPKSREKVLVSTEKTVFTQVFKGIYRTPNRWIWEHSSIKKVAAWMPLPTPWKGEKNEQQS